MAMDPQAAMRAAVAVPGVPRDADGPVFREPWEAQAFAMTLALHERGVFTWPEWAAALAAEIKRAFGGGNNALGKTVVELDALDPGFDGRVAGLHDEVGLAHGLFDRAASARAGRSTFVCRRVLTEESHLLAAIMAPLATTVGGRGDVVAARCGSAPARERHRRQGRHHHETREATRS